MFVGEQRTMRGEPYALEHLESKCPDVGAYCIRPRGCPDVGAHCKRPLVDVPTWERMQYAIARTTAFFVPNGVARIGGNGR